MPISREQFESGLDGSQMRILEFLRADPERAFSMAEIGEGADIAYSPPSVRGLDFWVVVGAVAHITALGHSLSDLEEKGLITSKVIQGEQYYMARLQRA